METNARILEVIFEFKSLYFKYQKIEYGIVINMFFNICLDGLYFTKNIEKIFSVFLLELMFGSTIFFFLLLIVNYLTLWHNILILFIFYKVILHFAVRPIFLFQHS